MKKIMKPLVKECMREMLLEEGLLSSLISEVMKGTQVVQESKHSNSSIPQMKQPIRVQENNQNKSADEARRRLAEAIGGGASRDAYANIFEGMTPAPGPDSFQENSDPGMDLNMLNNIPGLKGAFNKRG